MAVQQEAMVSRNRQAFETALEKVRAIRADGREKRDAIVRDVLNGGGDSEQNSLSEFESRMDDAEK